MKKRSLGRQILWAMILLVTVMLLVAGIIFVFTMKNTLDILTSSGDDLNDTIGKESSSIMAEQSQLRLLEMAESKAAIADEIFSEFEKGVAIAASAAEDVYDHPDQFTARPVSPPDAKNDGKLSLQVLYSAKTDPEDPQIVEELGLIGNVGEVLMAVNDSQENMASLYVATETGFMIQADYISAKKFDDAGRVMPLEARERPWYTGAVETGRSYFTPVTKDAHTPRLGIMCGVPVYSGGKLKGVAGAGMYLDGMQDPVRSVNLGESGNACIINEKGQVGERRGSQVFERRDDLGNGDGRHRRRDRRHEDKGGQGSHLRCLRSDENRRLGDGGTAVGGRGGIPDVRTASEYRPYHRSGVP